MSNRDHDAATTASSRADKEEEEQQQQQQQQQSPASSAGGAGSDVVGSLDSFSKHGRHTRLGLPERETSKYITYGVHGAHTNSPQFCGRDGAQECSPGVKE